jgi:sulfane dehydrogenase subunit SoxC
VRGWAWSAGPVAAVSVSTDAGGSWHPAQLEAPGASPTWQRFKLPWAARAPGTYEIRARATDREGRVQPDDGRNAVHAITVMVE